MTPEEIATLKQKHGDVFRITAAGESIIVRRPTQPEMDSFLETTAEASGMSEGQRQLVRDVCLAPTGAELEALLARKAGVHLTFAKRITQLAGVVDDAVVQGL